MLSDAPGSGVSPPSWPRYSDRPLSETSEGFLVDQVRRRQTVERKARFIGQLMRRRLDVRDIEDIGDAALSYAEVKALAAGDPRLIEQAQVDADLAKLERLARAWARNQERLRRQVDAAERHITGLEALDALGRQVETWRDGLAQRLVAGEPPPQWAAPLGAPPDNPDTKTTWAAQVAQVGVWQVCRRLPEEDLYDPETAPGVDAFAWARVVAAGRDARHLASDQGRPAPLCGAPPAWRPSRHQPAAEPLHR